MRQLTLRGFDSELENRLKETAEKENLSLNKAALRLMRRGAGIDEGVPTPEVVGNSLDHLMGVWTKEDGDEFREATSRFGDIDPEMWS